MWRASGGGRLRGRAGWYLSLDGCGRVRLSNAIRSSYREWSFDSLIYYRSALQGSASFE